MSSTWLFPLTLWGIAVGWSFGPGISWAIRSWPGHESFDAAYLSCWKCKGGIRRGCCNAGSRQDFFFALFSAIIAGLSVAFWGIGSKALLSWIFSVSCLIITVVDIRHLIIPDILSINGFYAGLLYSALISGWVYFGFFPPEHFIPFFDSLLGFLVGGGFLWFLGWIAWVILKKEGMGGGDVKLLATMGSWLGLKAVIGTIVLASFLGSIGGIFGILYQRVRYRKAYKPLTHLIPFGPYLCVGFLIIFYFGMEPLYKIINLYQQFLENRIIGSP
ncbi:prepilin peptidase [bacterium]|nr:prepilin peptidase [bacterium]